MLRVLLFAGIIAYSTGAQALLAQEEPVRAYVDPTQLDVPWPKMSHYRQPWRGFLETRSGAAFLSGVGVNLHVPHENEELAIRLLAETGFRTFRIEVGWGSMSWDETHLENEARVRRRFELCAKYGVRPTILINAHQGVPCPVRFLRRRLLADAPKGATAVRLDDVSDLVIGRTGLSGLSDYWAAEALITAIDAESGSVTLSKPLPKKLGAGLVPLATLKYVPLHPVGTPEFDETAAGWVRHALHVCRMARAAGVDEFDVELWNELTFGTHFLNINDYYDPARPRVTTKQPDFLNPGGRCWELAARTVDAVKREFPAARCIWGFSNTTFYHCRIENLPPGTDGQSYHPYGTGTRKFAGKPSRPDQPPVEGFVPTYEMRMPEGWAATFVQTECLMRLLRPDERLARKPRGTKRFYHYITEHGVLPPECGLTDAAGAWRLKAVVAARSFCFWLAKGVDVLHYFVAHDAKEIGFGLLPVDLRSLPPDARFEDVATPPMRTIRNLTRAFAGSEPLEQTDALSVAITGTKSHSVVFAGDAAHPPLRRRDVLVVLPFQVDRRKHVVAVYVMTRDITQPFEPEEFRLRIGGVLGEKVSCYDPVEDRAVPVATRPEAPDAVEITLDVAAHPRLLTIEGTPQ